MTRKKFSRRNFLKIFGGGAISLTLPGCRPQSISGKKPNIVFFLIDDLGWTDLTCYGSKYYETPNIDKLAESGMRFTEAYAACCVCSPTRASILTGKYPARLHLTDWIYGHKRPHAKLRVPDWDPKLELKEITLAEALKPAGYVSAAIGKWHLGEKGFFPEDQGFDLNVGGNRWGSPGSYFYPYQRKNHPEIQVPGLQKEGKKGEYLTDRLTDEAIKFVTKNRNKPFFLYFSHYAVHTPLEAKKDLIQKYRNKIDPTYPQRNPVYGGMVESVDESVGRILATLDQLNLSDNTVVFFMSDNGGLVLKRRGENWGITSNLPLRSGKGDMYEGGVREPMIVRWPGIVQPGTTCHEAIISNDFFPTILEMAGVRRKNETDGLSLVPLLKGKKSLNRQAIFWHYPHYHPGGATPYSAVRSGDWKLIEVFEDNHLELYNLKQDIGEKNNLAEKYPDKARALHQMLKKWRKEVRAQLPAPNPDYIPEEKSKTN